MTEEFRIAPVSLKYASDREMLIAFLARHGLTYEADIQTAFGVFDETDSLSACGCAAGALLKCFAVEASLRGQNILGPLVSALVQDRFSAGIYDLSIVTRQKNQEMFSHCGFFPVVRTGELSLLENRPNGPADFASSVRQPEDEGKTAGAIVMNCNPFTLGHQALVEYAAQRCEVLHLFVVEEDRSAFPTDVRLGLVREGTAHLPNVRVHLSGRYIISLSTFPTYFLKRGEDAAALQSELDITLFAQRIAPELYITKRFAGQEPLDPVTNRYNQTMRQVLPQYGIEFCEIPRLCSRGDVISASRVRELLREKGVCEEVLSLVPETTGRYLKTKFRGIK